MLEGRVRTRTEELTGLMHRLERSNAALAGAKEEAETANRSKTRFWPQPATTCSSRSMAESRATPSKPSTS